MSVIIRLQNLPWSANALDIRQFFRGLAIPEGGVHIVGGEMGDAFIAFSTDEDARQAMMHDREAINGVQIRLLLSSRAEMQKVIETARQQSLLALKKASGTLLTQPKASPSIIVQKPVVASAPAPAPQPPIITASSFQNILSNSVAAVTPSFLAYQQQAGLTLIPESNSKTNALTTKNNNDSEDSDSHHSREGHRSYSRDIRRSKSRSRERNIFRRRRERSRDRSRERDWPKSRRTSRHRSRSLEKKRDRSRERSQESSRERSRERERFRNNNRDSSRGSSCDIRDNQAKSNVAPWTVTNSYQVSYNSDKIEKKNFNKISPLKNYNKSMNSSVAGVTVATISPSFLSYNTSNQSIAAFNNYSLSSIINTSNSSDSIKGFALQNPYTTAQKALENSEESVLNTTSSSAIPGIFVEKKSEHTGVRESTNSLPQEPIAFANVNPYEQMYPNLFAQAAALNSGQKIGTTKSNAMSTDSTKAEETKNKEVDPNETNCVKISNMCSRTNYSDLRKFFIGLFIPHNGIKMLNDKHGIRVGIAYVQFSRHSSVTKALCRSNNLLNKRSVIIEPVSEKEFMEAEDSFRPINQEKSYSHRSNDSDNENGESGNNSGCSALNPYKKVIQLDPFTVLYIEDIPALATEQDIMKMFGSYSLYDILLIASPENRREFVAYVRFSREEDAKSAYEDRAHHQIGYRRVRVRPGTLEEMEKAKEKIRLANEQLIKEEKAAEEEAKRKLEKIITDHITQEEDKQQNEVMDLTQEDDDENNKLVEASTKNMESTENFEKIDQKGNSNKVELLNDDNYSMQSQLNNFNTNMYPRQTQTPNIPSLFDIDPLLPTTPRNQIRPNLFNDPRLRNMSEKVTDTTANTATDNNKNNPMMGGNNSSITNTNFNDQNEINMNVVTNTNHIENKFAILKNCDYNARINDVAQLLLTANLALKHIEPLRNERQLPSGEFIVEFRTSNDAEIAVQRFHNIVFRNRSLRVFPITPQEIADRLGKPFLSYIPGGNGIRMSKGMGIDNMGRNNFNMSNNLTNNNDNMRFTNNMPQNMNFNNFRSNNHFGDNSNNIGNSRNNKLNNSNSRNNFNGIPEKFARPGCVLSLENVPYKAQLSDILRFFQGFDLTPDDIIRRFNDDGSPTGDARVAFMSQDEARSAFDAKKRKQIFGRNIFIKIM